MENKNVKRGGLSKEVWAVKSLEDYVASAGVFGYVGHYCRSSVIDKIVEEELRKTGLKEYGVAVWLTSGSARHMGDQLEEYKKNSKDNVANIREIVKEYVRDAYIDVLVWSHPDHRGTWGSSSEIKGKIIEWVNANDVAIRSTPKIVKVV
jgi:hypothetical protein